MTGPSSAANIDVALVRRLIAMQFPQWTQLAIRPVAVSGWDNKTFHLGDDMLIRLPSASAYSAQVEKEQRWLPKLAPLLPVAIPVPLAMGSPAEGIDWHWSVYKWIEGETATIKSISDLNAFAISLAEFLLALQSIDATDGPEPGLHNFFRGGSLATYDHETRQAIEILGDKIDSESVKDIWALALSESWRHAPVWVHGDVSVGNLLLEGGRLCAVIDFGCSAVGDPACDLAIAWTFLHAESRDVFRRALPLDTATWARGRGWALWKALITLAGLTGSAKPAELAKCRETINAVIMDHQIGPS
jgi:aminoglycoside phosphotransferase (APT) family kinase protein